jgi:hypothetical protein
MALEVHTSVTYKAKAFWDVTPVFRLGINVSEETASIFTAEV